MNGLLGDYSLFDTQSNSELARLLTSDQIQTF
jgi:muconolactone delta-isomerase